MDEIGKLSTWLAQLYSQLDEIGKLSTWLAQLYSQLDEIGKLSTWLAQLYAIYFLRMGTVNLSSNLYIHEVGNIAWDVTLQERDNEKNELLVSFSTFPNWCSFKPMNVLFIYIWISILSLLPVKSNICLSFVELSLLN